MGGVAKDVFDFVEDVAIDVFEAIDPIAKIISSVVGSAVDVIGNVITAVKEGNIKDLIGAVASFVVGGPVGLGVYMAVRFGVPAVTQELVENGWISSEVAMYINVAAVIAATWIGYTNTTGSGMITNLQNLGVSFETATYISSLVSNFMPMYGVASTLYGVYDAYQSVKQMQMQYASAVAQFEAWYSGLKNNRAKSEASFNEAMAFATGAYYDRLPAQTLYSVFMPSAMAYLPVEQVQPAYWVESLKSPYKTEPEIATLMWQGKNDIPFNQKFGIDVL